MVIAFVTFPRPSGPIEKPRALLESTAPGYRDVPGLRRKYFIGNNEFAGGVYKWQDRESAVRFYDDAWRQRILDRYGFTPELQLFEAPCLVDNVVGRTEFAANAELSET